MIRRFKPLQDKLYWWITVPTALLMAAVSVVAFFAPAALWVMIPTDALIFYFLISPLFGYVELREESLFIKFGFIMKREIAYSKIRGATWERKFYADSMMALKNSLEHVNVRYNSFDIVSLSVVRNDEFVAELVERAKINDIKDNRNAR